MSALPLVFVLVDSGDILITRCPSLLSTGLLHRSTQVDQGVTAFCLTFMAHIMICFTSTTQTFFHMSDFLSSLYFPNDKSIELLVHTQNL